MTICLTYTKRTLILVNLYGLSNCSVLLRPPVNNTLQLGKDRNILL